MPASRPGARDGLIDALNRSAPTRAANNALPIAAYYRGCDLLISQAKVYRASGNEEQLYVMLMRFASLVIETIPRHAQYSPEAPQYRAFKQRVVDALAELDHLKASLRVRNVDAPAARTLRRPHDASLLVTSDLPDIDWGSVGAGPAAAAAAAAGGDARFSAEAAEWLARTASGAAAGTSGSAGAAAWAAAAAAAPSAPPFSGGGGGGSFSGGGAAPYQSAYVPSSQTSLDRHALFAPRAAARPGAAAAPPAPPRPRYPGVDRTPTAGIDLLWGQGGSSGGAGAGAAPSAPPAPPDGALSSLALSERRASGAGAGSLLDAPMAPRPSAGPSLGPQAVAVHGMDPALASPGGSCAHPPQPQQQQLVPAEATGGGVRPLEKRVEMRDVHVSVALMNDFLHYASNNTRRGIESCGILAGVLSPDDSIFRVTTLIIPKQEGTSDTVAALNEEDIYEAQASRELYPLGWIHTHPTQTCFLSSVDVHTQCGYQTMLDEAVAIVMAPTDARNRCGIFRLTTPGGLRLVQKCPLRGFHTHPDTATGQEVYELCGHVYLNPRVRHEVLDLR